MPLMPGATRITIVVRDSEERACGIAYDSAALRELSMKSILIAALAMPSIIRTCRSARPGSNDARRSPCGSDRASSRQRRLAPGKPVTYDLTKQDFAVTDEGKPRPIDIFSIERADADDPSASSPATPTSQTLPPNVFSNRNPRPAAAQAHSTVLILDQINTYVEDATYARAQVVSLMKKVPIDERIAIYAISRKEGLVLVVHG